MPKTFEQIIAEYYELNLQEKEAKDAKKPLNEEIKSEMSSRNLKTDKIGGFKVTVGTQDRSKMDSEKLVAKLKELGLTEAIKTVEVPDDAMIERLIYNDQLNAQVVQDCVIPNFVQTLTVKKI